jgi:acetyl-CoA acetyltransferase
MRDVYVVAVGMIPFGKYPDASMKDLTAAAMQHLMQQSPVTPAEIEAAWFSNSGWGMQTGQHCIRGQVALGPLGFAAIPIMNVENACAGGSSAFHGAWLGVAAGAYDVALAIGAEKTWVPAAAGSAEKKKAFDAFIGGTDVEVTKPLIDAMQAEAERRRAEMEARGELQKGAGGGARSPMMDIYAAGARAHMEKYGSTQEQLAIIAAKNHFHASLNPDAQYRMTMTVEEVLADRLVSYPLTRAMCAPLGDGAAAAVLVSGDALAHCPDARPVKVLASVVASGGHPGETARAARRAYVRAGLGPDDVDVAEVHDATAFGEVLVTEALGFCAEGEGGSYAESGATKLGGSKPVNTSGGLECRGHPIGASGLAQITEVVHQLRGDAGERQVEGARIGLTENGGGFIAHGEAAVTIHLFESVTRPR